MKRHLLACMACWLMAHAVVHAQFIPQGIHYQAVLLDDAGRPLSNSKVVLRISMTADAAASGTSYFSETHQVRTDDQGQLQVVIGEGKRLQGVLAEVPWAERQIFLRLELEGKRANQFKPIGTTQLLSVPYAMHAHTTGGLVEDQATQEKNQSIYWLTSGNSLTVPGTQFLGTRDNQDFIIKTNDTVRVSITKEGQYQVTAGASVNGEQDDINAYPLTVSGSNQGIYIKVNGSRTGANNFLTFGDDVQFSWGRVEGQTFPELQQTWQYKLQVASFALAGASLASRIAAAILNAIGNASAVCDGPAAVADAAMIIAFVIEAAGVLANSITWDQGVRREIGVYYATGAGDYAEWLERQEGEHNLAFGQVVGVKAGKVSLHTGDADQFMVVSMRPAVLGNNPAPEQKHRYEKIAFLGQVPVRVAGPVAVGDFILPSGNHDGLAIAVHPDKMKTGDFARIVGVAWEGSQTDLPFNFINTAVGINARELSHKVDILERRVDNITAYLEGKEPLFEPEVIAQAAAAVHQKPQTQMVKVFTDAEYDQILDRCDPLLKGLSWQVEKELKKRGFDMEKVYIKELLENPVPMLKEMRRNPAFYTQWAMVDRQLSGDRK